MEWILVILSIMVEGLDSLLNNRHYSFFNQAVLFSLFMIAGQLIDIKNNNENKKHE